MKYDIQYSEDAKKDINDIIWYISNILEAPKAARFLFEKIVKDIHRLSETPTMFPFYDKLMLSRALRYFPVKKYLVFYDIVENKKEVEIIRILYGGTNLEKQLIESKKG